MPSNAHKSSKTLNGERPELTLQAPTGWGWEEGLAGLVEPSRTLLALFAEGMAVNLL